jgi:hypothetical protein
MGKVGKGRFTGPEIWRLVLHANGRRRRLTPATPPRKSKAANRLAGRERPRGRGAAMGGACFVGEPARCIKIEQTVYPCRADLPFTTFNVRRGQTAGLHGRCRDREGETEVKVFGSQIAAAVRSGRLAEPFTAAMVKRACPGWADRTYHVFLPKHAKGNGRTTELFIRVGRGFYRLNKSAG